MDKKMVFEHYCDLLDDLREQSLAFQNFLIHNDTDEDWVFDNAEVACGATRAALIDTQNDYPYIVKWDIDYDEWGDSSSAREVEIYKEAKYCGLASYFTEAVYLGEYRRIVWAHIIEGYYNEKLGYDLVGLKDPTGNINYYIYKNGKYSLYKEHTFNGTTLQILDKKIDGYKQVEFLYDNDKITSYQEVKMDIIKNTYALDNNDITGNQFYLFYANNSIKSAYLRQCFISSHYYLK